MSQTHLKSFNGRQWDILQSISGLLHPFRGLGRAPKPYFGQKMTVSDPPCQPGPIFLARNAFKICPINSFTSFMLNLHLQESLRPPKRPSKAKNGQNFTFLAISGSVLSDFANFPTSPLKYEKNAAFGSHVALSVLQIDLRDGDTFSWVHH